MKEQLNALKYTNVNWRQALTSCFHVLSSSAKVVKSLGAQKYLHSGLGPSGELLICSMSLSTSPRIKGSIKYTGILWLDINPRNFLTTCCLTEDRNTIFPLKLLDRKKPQPTERRKSYLPTHPLSVHFTSTNSCETEWEGRIKCHREFGFWSAQGTQHCISVKSCSKKVLCLMQGAINLIQWRTLTKHI